MRVRPHSLILLITALLPATGFHSGAVTHTACTLDANRGRCPLRAAPSARIAPWGAVTRCSVRGMLKGAAGAQPVVRHSSWARRCSSGDSSRSGGETAVEDSSGRRGGSELTHEERVAIYSIEECAPHAGVRSAPLLSWIL